MKMFPNPLGKLPLLAGKLKIYDYSAYNEKSRNWPLFFHSCFSERVFMLKTCKIVDKSTKSNWKNWNFSSRKDENLLEPRRVSIISKLDIYFEETILPTIDPPFFPFTLVSREYLLEIMVSKTVDKLNSTSPVRKQLATIELKVSNLSRKHELAKPVLKQRVLSISLTFSSSRPSISQTYPIFISKRLVGSAARSSNTRRRRRGRRKRRKRARKVANGHYTATIASLSTVCNVTCLRGLARHLRSYRAIILSCIPALCQLSFLTFRYSFPIPKRPAVSSTLFPHFPTPRWNILT